VDIRRVQYGFTEPMDSSLAWAKRQQTNNCCRGA